LFVSTANFGISFSPVRRPLSDPARLAALQPQKEEVYEEYFCR
jgi:hypothetical protein